MDIHSIQVLEFINNRLSNIEKNIQKLDEKLEFSIQLQRNHLIRIKHGEDLDDSAILLGRPYNDLSPSRAFELYSEPNYDFIFLDVSRAEFKTKQKIPEAIKIPLEELGTRFTEIQSKTTPILIFSEKGLRSIQAAELLVKRGFFNVNNISGGYQFWPGFKSEPAQAAS